jgi:serine/threonine protein kinase
MRKTSMGGSVKKIGPYQLTIEIGRGAFSKVFKATNETTNKEYAIKMISKTELQTDKL